MHGPQRCCPGLSEDDLARNRPLIGEHRIEGTSHIFKPHCFHPRHLLAMDSEEPTKSLSPPPDEFVSLTDLPYFVSLCCYVAQKGANTRLATQNDITDRMSIWP
jgi:hypothetical protein